MFSIQQLMKSTRKLQANGVNVSSSDLAKSLKYSAITGKQKQQQQPPCLESGSSVLMTMTSSLLAQHDVVTSPTTAMATSKSPQQQQTNATSQPQDLDIKNSSDSQTNSQHSKNTVNILSLCSHLNENGSHIRTISTLNSNTQELKLTTTPTATKINHSRNFRNRSQQIQNFYQQQLHQFHTQHNHSLWAKQKQTHFTMSSLAAAEPLSVLKSSDDIGATSSNGSKCGDSTEENSTASAANTGNKTCFKSGYAEILQFMELIGNLKHTKRTGWVLRDVNDCESISGHMYRMSMMTFLLDGTEGLNQIRCMELALVHDLAESIVGDLTPFCGISKEDKRAMEFKAMDDICKLIEPRGKRIMELFEEYELGQSAESQFVKDLDRLDMVMQAFEYEKRDNCLLKHQEFFDSTEGKFRHPFVQQLVKEIYEQRKNLAKEKGASPPPNVVVVPDWEHPTNGHSNGHSAKNVAAATEPEEKQSSTSTSTS